MPGCRETRSKKPSEVIGERVRAALPVVTPPFVGLFDLLGGFFPDDDTAPCCQESMDTVTPLLPVVVA